MIPRHDQHEHQRRVVPTMWRRPNKNVVILYRTRRLLGWIRRQGVT